MSWDLQTAQTHLQAWLEAELAVATSQSYRMGTKYLQRADLKHIHNQIKFWRNEVLKLQTGSKGRRVRQVIPWDR